MSYCRDPGGRRTGSRPVERHCGFSIWDSSQSTGLRVPAVGHTYSYLQHTLNEAHFAASDSFFFFESRQEVED